MLKHRTNTALLFLVTGIWLISRFFYPVSWVFLPVAGGVWLVFTVIGSFHIRWNYHLHALHQNPASDAVALTFDDGPTRHTEAVLDLLARHGQKATFFLIGRQAAQFPEVVRRMVAEGHGIGNHTWSHSPRTGFWGTEKMELEMRKTDRILEELTGERVIFYRPPYGVTNPSVKKAVQATGHTVAGWSVRSLDTVIRDEKALLRRIIRRLRPGRVILLHDTSEKTVNVVKSLLEEMGPLRSVTLQELFK